MTFSNVFEFTKLDTQTKFILLNLLISSLGRLARKKEYVSNLFHFLELFPLVSSKNMTRGRVRVSTTCCYLCWMFTLIQGYFLVWKQ